MPVFDIYDEKVPRRVVVETETNSDELIVRITIGRTADNNVIIHESRSSRNHCQVRLADTGSYTLHDLASRNGTYLNQQRVDEPIPLEDGDEIEIGKSTLRFWTSRESIDPKAPKLPIIVKYQNDQQNKPIF